MKYREICAVSLLHIINTRKRLKVNSKLLCEKKNHFEFSYLKTKL